MTDVELEPEQFREIPGKPLANPRDLRWGAALWGLYTLLAAFAAWRLGTWWSALLPVPTAIWLGACIAGLNPRYFFGSGR